MLPPSAGPAEALTNLGFVCAGASRSGPAPVRVVFTRGSMATRVRVTVVDGSATRAETAAGRALEEMDRVVAHLDRHTPASAVSVLNDVGSLDRPPRELLDVIGEARRLHRSTGAAFDITVKPLLDHVRASCATPPDEVLALADMSAVSVDRWGLRLSKAGMGITLDGIAKGYVVDRMAAMLDALGCNRWLIEAGGDVRASGLREDDRPWRVAVRDPASRGTLGQVVSLTAGAVATSGAYEQSFDARGLRHHIVHGTHRGSPRAVASATVRAPTASTADALATAAFVLGRGALPLIDSFPGCACLLLERDGRTAASRRWPDLTGARP